MLKLPKGLKKKKKGKKSKRKGDEELFTKEELEKYKREHQEKVANGEGSAKENEEWSKFKDLTTGIDSVLKKTQGDLDRIKSTSFFQRVPVGPKQVAPERKETLHRPVVEVTEADFPQLVQQLAHETDDADNSEYGVTEDESEEEEQDDIFDTSYVDAVERGEVKLAYVPDSPEGYQDDDIFDTSHVDALIKGQETKVSKGKNALDIGIAVGVLTGRIDNVTVTTKRAKRVIPGDLLLENIERDIDHKVVTTATTEEVEKSILDIDSDIPITTPIDLSISLHTSLIQTNSINNEKNVFPIEHPDKHSVEDEFDEFTLLATKSLEVNAEISKLDEKEIKLEPVLQESWSAFEADKNESVFAEYIVEDQIEILDPNVDQDDPFDTSFADAVIPLTLRQANKETVIPEDEEDDFDPRAEEVKVKLNNRRKSSVRIHLIDPSGIRESITSDDIINQDDSPVARDLLGASTTDLTQLGDSLLDPVDVNKCELDPFDTTIVDQIAAPGKIELKLLEEELISANSFTIYRVPSDPDFDPRAEEKKTERRPSRPENLIVSKSVVFNVESKGALDLDTKNKIVNPVTPYYTRERSITEDANEEAEEADIVPETLSRARSTEDLTNIICNQTKRRHSEYSQISGVEVIFKGSDLLQSGDSDFNVKVLTPSELNQVSEVIDPFDTSFATNFAPSRTELKLLAKEFSCEETNFEQDDNRDFLDPSDDIFQVKALTPELQDTNKISEQDLDPFDTSFACDLNPGKTELKLLESEFLG